MKENKKFSLDNSKELKEFEEQLMLAKIEEQMNADLSDDFEDIDEIDDSERIDDDFLDQFADQESADFDLKDDDEKDPELESLNIGDFTPDDFELEKEELEDIYLDDAASEQEHAGNETLFLQEKEEVDKTIKEISDMLDSIIAKEKPRNYEDEELIDGNETHHNLNLEEIDLDFVPDYFRDGDWELVIDEETEEENDDGEKFAEDKSKEESVPTVEFGDVEKKSLSLTTILLVGGGMLALGLTTAGVVSYVKNKRVLEKEPVVEIKPLDDVSQSEPVNTEPVKPEPMHRPARPMPIIPLWPIFAAPPRQGYDQVG